MGTENVHIEIHSDDRVSIFGESGNDTLVGGNGILLGGSGSDKLASHTNSPDALLYGGRGADDFYLFNKASLRYNGLSDGDFNAGHHVTIKDFDANEGDTIHLPTVQEIWLPTVCDRSCNPSRC